MSGASGSFPAIIHLHPEAAKGGNIGKIKDNDSLTINLETGNLDIDLSEDELNLRSVELNPISQEGVGRELFNIFRNSVADVDDGILGNLLMMKNGKQDYIMILITMQILKTIRC